MILVEADDELAACVHDFFVGQYDVTRVADLEAASRELRSGTEDVLIADIDSGTPAQTAFIESLRHTSSTRISPRLFPNGPEFGRPPERPGKPIGEYIEPVSKPVFAAKTLGRGIHATSF